MGTVLPMRRSVASSEAEKRWPSAPRCSAPEAEGPWYARVDALPVLMLLGVLAGSVFGLVAYSIVTHRAPTVSSVAPAGDGGIVVEQDDGPRSTAE
jgi:hypothetical protein